MILLTRYGRLAYVSFLFIRQTKALRKLFQSTNILEAKAKNYIPEREPHNDSTPNPIGPRRQRCRIYLRVRTAVQGRS